MPSLLGSEMNMIERRNRPWADISEALSSIPPELSKTFIYYQERKMSKHTHWLNELDGTYYSHSP